ncbi:MAG: hypothetical protein LUF82_04930 [Clostridia bacterium]|nr:hypothetical protein [Clostridia bacterium]
MNRLLNLLEPYSRLLYERHTRKLGPAFKMLFIFLELKCAANLKKVGLYEKSANTAFIEMVRKTANRCHISVEELKDKRIKFRKAYGIPTETQPKGKNHKKYKRK